MIYRKLGDTDIDVSVICLGSMTWGEQNTLEDGFEQMHYAIDQGVNFFDTAELYAIPPKADTYGRTEEIIGEWLKKTGKRNKIVLASKMAGPGEGWIDHIRNGKTRFGKQDIENAVNASLKRLQTDCIDLYQLHWPERKANYFGQLGYTVQQDQYTSVIDTLEALKTQIDAGKIRHIGLSNDTPWGVMSFIKATEKTSLPRIVSVQNPYSLLNRSYEVGLAEISYREQCGLLAYSPLGFGVLSGKYLNGQNPKGARLTLWPDYSRYSNNQAVAATEKYVALANKHNLNVAQMALAYVNNRPFLTSTIIGATSLEQLKINICSSELVLSNDVLEEIELIHSETPNPSP